MTLRIVLAAALALAGCGPKRPLRPIGAPPNFAGQCGDHYQYNHVTGRCELKDEPVPGHPGLHFGPPHLECDISNNCVRARTWLTADNKPVLSSLGCFLAKARVTWIFGDRPSMCEKGK